MKSKTLFLLACLLLILSPLWGGEVKKSFTILYSASLNGNLDGCECKSNPRAGLVKRAYYLKRFKDIKNSILIDTGDILDVIKDTTLATYILDSYKELGYTAIGVGDQEFINGIDSLYSYRKEYPLLSHNLIICPTEESCVFFSLQPHTFKKGGITGAIISLIDPGVTRFFNQGVKDKIKVKEPAEVLKNMFAFLADDFPDIIICIFHGYYPKATALLEEVKGVDLMILGHEQQYISPTKTGDTVIVSPGNEGNSLGILTVYMKADGSFSFANKFQHFDYFTDPDDESVRERIEEYSSR